LQYILLHNEVGQRQLHFYNLPVFTPVYATSEVAIFPFFFAATMTTSKYPMIPVDDALRIVLSKTTQPIGVESIDMEYGVETFLDRIIAEDIVAKDPLPPFRASIMDGYAVIASDGVGTYDMISSITAGIDVPNSVENNRYDIKPGQVSYITTGAPVPPSADAVIRIEDTEYVDGHPNKVKINVPVKSGKWIRPIGSDVQRGQVVVEKNTTLSPALIGLLATVGATKVKAYKKPNVCIISTGDELLEPWERKLTNGKIRDSNRFMLLAAAKKSGANILNLGIVRDKAVDLKKTLQNAIAKSDVVISSGGVSMGSLDLVKDLLEELGTVHFGRMCMKPGKPTTFATICKDDNNLPNGKCEKLFFGLPGNPVSSLVAYHLLVDPAIKALSGVPINKCHHARINARIAMPLKLDPVRPEYHRSVLTWRETVGTSGEFIADSTGIQRSSRLLSMRESSALLCLPKGNTTLNPGEIVPALLIGSNPIPPPTHVTPHLDASLTSKVETRTNNKNVKISTQNIDTSDEKPDADDDIPVCACCGVKKTNIIIDDTPPPRYGGIEIDNSSNVRIGVITVSDRASNGVYPDQGGPEILRCINDNVKSLWESEYRIIPDEQRIIESTICDLSDRVRCNIIITTGGTGPAERDLTPDATMNVCGRLFPGFGERMRQISLQYIPSAILSRQVAGTRGKTFIINLPGSPHSVRQILPSIFDAIIHISYIINNKIKIIRKETSIGNNSDNNMNNNNNNDDHVFEHLFVIDQVNVDWIERQKSGNGRKFTEHEIIDNLFQLLFADIKSDATVQDIIFTVPRGKGRKKKKTRILLKLSNYNYQWILKMKAKYDVPNVDKIMRIILDYVLENEE
jgi:gephyrin